VSIIGFDDIPEAQYLIPSLTTVKQDFIELGKIVISRVLESLKGESSHETLLVQPTLTVRDSTAQLTGKKRK